MPPAVRDSCARIGAAMVHARQPWWVIGSAAVALHGADAGAIGDVDRTDGASQPVAPVTRVKIGAIRAAALSG